MRRPNETLRVIDHYNRVSPYYRKLWGEHLYHGYWIRELPRCGGHESHSDRSIKRILRQDLGFLPRHHQGTFALGPCRQERDRVYPLSARVQGHAGWFLVWRFRLWADCRKEVRSRSR